MAKPSAIEPAADDPRPEVRWEIVSCDTFDRECSPSELTLSVAG